jgi:(2S)-methylsuccinyl-CoA dehydrogenase
VSTERPTALGLASAALADLAALQARATDRVAALVMRAGRVDAELLDLRQRAAHGLAWFAATIAAIREQTLHAARLQGDGELTEIDDLLLGVAASDYAAQLLGGVAMGQGETARPADLGLTDAAAFRTPAIAALISWGADPAPRARLAALLAEGVEPAAGLDPTLVAMRDEMRRFTAAEVAPHAHGWHLADAYVPMTLIGKLAALGVFGLTIPEAHGGLGLSKVAMCVVSEELSRGWIAVGSLGTRSEIAAELILHGGTEAQKTRLLPLIASGAVIPTAVFTEPDTGSDLASIRTRAVLDGDVWRLHGQKTWITHAARADLMTVMARTDPDQPGYRGLSILLAEKPRGADADPFPAPGLRGSEISVLGYRGMKEYELAFDGFACPADSLLGGVAGQGFKQLMQTFEAARIQTAARAVGVAASALDVSLAYARQRRQFGRPLIAFPRVADKIAMMAAETEAARRLTYFAAREKDAGRRCDLEAGMAKLIAARAAWAAADMGVQIHGGNGFALEYPISRILCDARILSIFEGAAEIQAQVIARRLLEA